MKIAIASIHVTKDRRKVDPAWVATIAEDFVAIGHHTPIDLLAEGDGFRLIYGQHRLEAAKSLGWTEIEATVRDRAEFASDTLIVLREISENLIRRQPSALDRSVDIARWREAYVAAHGVAKPGRKKADPAAEDDLSAKFALNFSDAAQRTLGLSRRSVFLALKIARILPAARDAIALHPIADNQAELLLLADQPPERQATLAAMLTAEPPQAGSVTEAVALLDKAPPMATPKGWEKVASAFSSLKPADQQRFFELHEAAILAWLEGRNAR